MTPSDSPFAKIGS